ncbi:MAG: cell wall hydrolase [Lachnospiraceae bacterium]|nr:cell wall hydrolase [Lachnospiraceae bacterium]
MLRIHSFLQSIYGYVKSISKRLYRTCAIITTGTAVIAVIAFSSHGFGGSGKNHVVTVYPALETDSEYEETEEVEADTEAKIQTETISENSEVQSIETKKTRIEPQVESVVPRESAVVTMAGGREAETEASVTEYEYDILLHIVAAEARGCDLKGQILVANVILNRVEDEHFPDTIEEVVFQKNQFSPVVEGTLWSTPVTDSVREAVDYALEGVDYSQGALFFSARARLGGDSMAWFDSNLEWLFEHDGHEFYAFK